MHRRLKVIKNEQNIPLNQPETQNESNPNFESFSANPTQKIHPEIIPMIVDLNQQIPVNRPFPANTLATGSVLKK